MSNLSTHAMIAKEVGEILAKQFDDPKSLFYRAKPLGRWQRLKNWILRVEPEPKVKLPQWEPGATINIRKPPRYVAKVSERV